MNLNNQMYTYFNNMMNGYANNNIDTVEQNVRCWIQIAPENPFQYDTPEYEEFFQIKRCYTIWSRGDVNGRINRRNMVKHAVALCALNPKQPYTYDRKAEQEDLKKQEIVRKEELRLRKENIFMLIDNMKEKYISDNKVEFENSVFALMQKAEDNPFEFGSDEYEQFSLMLNSYKRNPINKTRLLECAEKLCKILTHREEPKKVINEEPKTVLGVLPDEKEEKKSWFKFLNPWRKDGD